MIYKERHGMYGHCWIEGDGVYFWVYVNTSKYGPYSSLMAADEEFRKWC